MTITLSPEEIQFVKMVAATKHLPDRADKKLGNNEYTDEYSKQINFDGFMGELAVARALNVYPEFAMPKDTVSRIDGTFMGVTYDVKTTRYEKGHLLQSLGADKYTEADIFILCVVDEPTVRIAGWIAAEELFTDRYMDYFKNMGRKYVASQDDLNPIHQLVNYA